MLTTSTTATTPGASPPATGSTRQHLHQPQQGQQQQGHDDNAAPPALRGELNNGSSLGCSISPHRQLEDETKPPLLEDDGADGRIDSLVRTMMTEMDEGCAECLEGGKREVRQQRQKEENQEEMEVMEEEQVKGEGEGEQEKEKEVRPTADASFGSSAPLQAVLMDGPVGEAIEGAMALSKKMKTSTKNAFARACDIAINNQAVVAEEWKKVASALYHLNMNLTTDNSRLSASNSKLEAKQLVLEQRIQALETAAAAGKAERDRAASDAKEPWDASPPGRRSIDKTADYNTTATPSVVSPLNVLAAVASTTEPLPVATTTTKTTTAKSSSKDRPVPVMTMDAATATATTTTTAAAIAAEDSAGPSVLSFFADIAASAEPLPTTTAATTTTTAKKPSPDDPSKPSGLAMLASLAASAEPLPLDSKTMDTTPAPTATTAATPTDPPIPAATTAAAPIAPTASASSAAATAAVPIAPTASAASAAAAAASTATPRRTASTAATAASTASPHGTSVYANENATPLHGRGENASAGTTDGRPRWVGVRVGSAVVSPPDGSSVERPASTSRFSPAVARTPLGTVPINTTPRSVLADTQRVRKAMGFGNTKAGVYWRGNSDGGFGGGGGGGRGGLSRALVTRRNDGGGVSVEAEVATESRRASATRATLSSKAAARSTAMVATERAVSVQRPSSNTRSRMTDREPEEGVARRLRSAGRSTGKATPAVVAGGPRKVLTRQAAATRGGGKVVQKQWV